MRGDQFAFAKPVEIHFQILVQETIVRRGDLTRARAAENLRRAVPRDAGVDSGHELLRREQHHSEGASTFGDVEDLLLGLCRYPASVKYRGRDLQTRVGQGWRLAYFCKTQYASLHGWEHFLRCHRTVVELLSFWRTLGIGVRISDDGGYWPRRSEKALRRRLGEMNSVVAAAAGALKDSGGGAAVESPIFQHRQFESLEAAGAQKHGRKVLRAAEIIGKLASKK